MGELKPVTTADEFRRALGLKVRAVPAPEVGTTLYLRHLSASELVESARRAREAGADKPEGEQDQAKLVAFQNWLLSRALVTPDGKQFLGEDDLDAVTGLVDNGPLIARLVAQINADAAMRQEDLDALKKGSPPTPSNGSPCASPSSSASGTSTGGW